MTSVVATRNVSRSYGKGEAAFTALDNINLSIDGGESVAIVGKSGSGKSTLMHLLALLDKPTNGIVVVGAQDSSRMTGGQVDALRNRTFGFVFQQFYLNGKDSVLNNVVLPLKIAGVGGKERIDRGIDALKSVGLEGRAGSKAADLSGGQKQRVCIARALINRPVVIFADEPTGNLDTINGRAVEDLLFRLNQEHGITLIIVTHDPDLAARCQRQINLKDGVMTDGSDNT
jgi:putative ABC transport system ATP-binding protein